MAKAGFPEIGDWITFRVYSSVNFESGEYRGKVVALADDQTSIMVETHYPGHDGPPIRFGPLTQKDRGWGPRWGCGDRW